MVGDDDVRQRDQTKHSLFDPQVRWRVRCVHICVYVYIYTCVYIHAYTYVCICEGVDMWWETIKNGKEITRNILFLTRRCVGGKFVKN